jgi:hypothetical protein
VFYNLIQCSIAASYTYFSNKSNTTGVTSETETVHSSGPHQLLILFCYMSSVLWFPLRFSCKNEIIHLLFSMRQYYTELDCKTHLTVSIMYTLYNVNVERHVKQYFSNNVEIPFISIGIRGKKTIYIRWNKWPANDSHVKTK